MTHVMSSVGRDPSEGTCLGMLDFKHLMGIFL